MKRSCRGLGENLLKATSGREALEHLLKSDIAVILVDVCMPDLDGFQLAAMIREHPRYQKIAMIFISAIHLSELDRLRGYEMGAVDYVPVPVVPELLRRKSAYSQTSTAKRAISKTSMPNSKSASPSAPLNLKTRPGSFAKANSVAHLHSPPARWADGTGTASITFISGTRPAADFRRRHGFFRHR